MPSVASAFSAGFLACATLIVAIGAQNVFVLRQGLQRRHVGPIVLFCGLADTSLVAAGVAGAGSLLTLSPGLATALTLGGAAFLLWYGGTALRRATNPSGLPSLPLEALPLGRTLAATAAITFLNPHVYLDTVMLMGALGASELPSLRPVFVVGAGTASFAWFTAIGFGARWVAPAFARPGTWRLLDALVGATMLFLSFGLLRHALRGA